MTITNGYCTEPELRAHFGDAGASLEAAGVERSINAASRWIDKHCNRQFWTTDEPIVRTYLPSDPYVAWIDDIHTTVGLVIKTDSAGSGTFTTTWASTDYQLEPLNNNVLGEPWYRIVAVGRYTFPAPCRRPTLQVTGRPGWAEIPSGVNQACILRSASLYLRREAPLGVAAYADWGPVRIARMDSDVIELLGPLRRKRLLVG